MKYKRIFTYLKEISEWLKLVRFAILALILIVLAIFCCLLPSVESNYKILCGLSLQVIGMLIAFRVLNKLRCKYRPSLSLGIKEWASLRPQFKKVVTLTLDQIVASSFMSTEVIQRWHENNPNEGLEERIDKIFLNLDNLKKRQNSTREQIEKNCMAQEKSSYHIKQELITAKKEIKKEVNESFADDIFHSLIGLLLLLFGVTISTLTSIQW